MQFHDMHTVMNLDVTRSPQAVMTNLAILAHPESHQYQLSFSDLARILSSSESTVHRAIEELEAQQLLRCWRAHGRAHQSLFEIDLKAVENRVMAMEKARGVKMYGVRMLTAPVEKAEMGGKMTATDTIEEKIKESPEKEINQDALFASDLGRKALRAGLGAAFLDACRQAGEILPESKLDEIAAQRRAAREVPEDAFGARMAEAHRRREENLRAKYLS